MSTAPLIRRTSVRYSPANLLSPTFEPSAVTYKSSDPPASHKKNFVAVDTRSECQMVSGHSPEIWAIGALDRLER